MAFDRLKSYLLSLKKEKVAVFLDELPWMDTAQSHFLAAFSSFGNNWGNVWEGGQKVKVPLLKLYVCGSATTWMVGRLIGDKGGLHGRINRQIYVLPFSLAETEEFLNTVKRMHFGREQVVDAYMVLGGIPYYLGMLDASLPLSINIDRLFFSPGAPLLIEFDFLYRSYFKGSGLYRKVMEQLSQNLSGMTREEISLSCKLDGGELTKILKNLCCGEFIRAYSSPGKRTRGKIFQLNDLFALYYLHFVEQSQGQDEQYWTHLSQTGARNAWAGYAFEQVCLHHIPQIKKALGISGILCNAYAWSYSPFTDADGNEWRGGQIDLVLDRADHVMNLCEIKHCADEHVIPKDLASTIRSRTELFRRIVKTKKDLRCTFITMYGVKQNSYSGIVHSQLTMDDLFC